MSLLSHWGMGAQAASRAGTWRTAVITSSALWTLVLVLVAGSAIGLFYYLRIVVVMFTAPAESPASATGAAVGVVPASGLVLALLAVLLVWFGVYPAPFLRLIEAAVAGLS